MSTRSTTHFVSGDSDTPERADRHVSGKRLSVPADRMASRRNAQASARPPRVLSLFSGAGGLDLGFISAGFHPVAFVETQEWACQTLRHNHPDVPVIGPPFLSGDVRDVGLRPLQNKAGTEAASPDVIIGGPPCQPFSVAAAQRFLRGDERFKRTGHDDKNRGTLFTEFFRIVAELKPRAFLLENVPGLKTLDGGSSLRAAIQVLEKLEYQVCQPVVLQAADYGVPQLRERLFVLGTRRSRPEVPPPSHGKLGTLLRPHNTVAKALVGMPQNLPNHVTRKHAPESIERYRRLRVGQREQLGRVDRLDPTLPSKTVIAGGSGGGGRSHLHPYIARTLTVRECARLQSFPDDFVFAGAVARQFTQVGNAVPPLMAWYLANSLAEAEFGQRLSGSFAPASYLDRVEDVAVLVAQLVAESRAQMPNWLYHDVAPSAALAA